MKDMIEVDGVKYARVVPNGKRAVIVVDRGWIFAGDVTDENGRVYLDRAVSKADIRPMSTRVDIPRDAELFRLPVGDDWGL